MGCHKWQRGRPGLPAIPVDFMERRLLNPAGIPRDVLHVVVAQHHVPIVAVDVGQAPAAGVVSPKTGEALPMAVVLAAICLAGAAVCAKKARCNG